MKRSTVYCVVHDSEKNRKLVCWFALDGAICTPKRMQISIKACIRL